jgi:NAD(P)-dependent dehydrogenase (short-subunit alcohol dehydrogenase family)
MSHSSIAGKTVVITGAASGIGRALALGFAADGARVVASDISEGGLLDIASPEILTRLCNVEHETEVRGLVDFALKRTGRVDVLFNNAGVAPRALVENFAEDAFEHCMRVHVFGAVYGLRAVLPAMRRQRYGRIVNMLSRGMESRGAGWAAYGAAKSALYTLTRVVAAEAADTDILVNGMIPGPTRSGMNVREGLQEPEAVYPGALWLATLPTGGSTGKVFWNAREYRPFVEADASAT